MEHAGDQMKRVPAPQDQHGASHQAADQVPALFQDQEPAHNRKQQVEDIKRAFAL